MTAAMLAEGEARRLDREIRLQATSIITGLDRLKHLIDTAEAGEIHKPLGFRSWPEYLQDVFGQEHLRLGRDERRELVSYLAGTGLSQRAIAGVAHIDRETVGRDLAAVAGNDGSGSTEPEPSGRGAAEIPVAERSAPVVEIPLRPAAPRPAQSAGTSTLPRVTGRDGKSYGTSHPRQQQPRRRPELRKTHRKTGDDLRRLADRLDQLSKDDRLPQHRDMLRGDLGYNLQRMAEVCQRLLNQLAPPELDVEGGGQVVDLYPAETADVVIRLSRHSAIVEHGWPTAWGHLKVLGAPIQKNNGGGLPSFPRQFADDLAAAAEMKGKTVRIITDDAVVVADE